MTSLEYICHIPKRSFEENWIFTKVIPIAKKFPLKTNEKKNIIMLYQTIDLIWK